MNDQRSLMEQLADLVPLAVNAGLYDAADYVKNVVQRHQVRQAEVERKAQRREGQCEYHNCERDAVAMYHLSHVHPGYAPRPCPADTRHPCPQYATRLCNECGTRVLIEGGDETARWTPLSADDDLKRRAMVLCATDRSQMVHVIHEFPCPRHVEMAEAQRS